MPPVDILDPHRQYGANPRKRKHHQGNSRAVTQGRRRHHIDAAEQLPRLGAAQSACVTCAPVQLAGVRLDPFGGAADNLALLPPRHDLLLRLKRHIAFGWPTVLFKSGALIGRNRKSLLFHAHLTIYRPAALTFFSRAQPQPFKTTESSTTGHCVQPDDPVERIPTLNGLSVMLHSA